MRAMPRKAAWTNCSPWWNANCAASPTSRYARNGRGHTFQATALVNEAYLKPVDQSRANWQNRPDEVGMKSVQQKLPRDEPLRCMLDQKEGENGNPGSNR